MRLTGALDRLRKAGAGLLVLTAIVSATAFPAFGQTSKRKPRLRSTRHPVVRQKTTPAPAPIIYTVNGGQVIRVRMNQTISSETARIGDQFTTTVVDPLYSGSTEIIPDGSILTGRVRTVQRAARQSKAGTIGVQFVSLRLPGGNLIPINGDLMDVTSESVSADNEGQVSGRSVIKRNVVFIGGGTATGALIGAIAGGGKGAGIGAGIGAGVGVAGAYFSKGNEAVVKSGTQFGVLLNQSITLPAANVHAL